MITYGEVMQQLRRQEYAPVYFLCGEEPYYIDKVSDYIEQNVLDDMAREFDQTIIYSKDLQPSTQPDVAPVIAAARRYPMMGQRQVIIVKEAQNIKKWEALGLYLEKPMPTTILVFCYRYGKPDARKKEFKQIEKSGGVMMESPKMRDNQVEPWIREYVADYAKEHGRNLMLVHPASTIIAENIGADMQKIVSEIDKLLLALPPDTEQITPEMVERCIGISKDFNVFELERALVSNDALKAYRIVDYFADNKQHPLQKEVAVLFGFFANIMVYHYLSDKSQMNVSQALGVNPYFVKDYVAAARRFSAGKTMKIIGYIREADYRSKGFNNTSADEKALWQELIYKILN